MKNILFVYKANSGKANAVLDSIHKIVKPETYSCGLCKLTHGIFTENKKWRDFKLETIHNLEFLHKDEFEKQYASKFGSKFNFPIVLLKNADEFELLVSAKELNTFKSTEDLITVIKERV
ncbi:hypothetical protein SAMN04488096_108164 [Mesonia phycicola]|uniref:GTPase n=1 Tax=Mesonia phycicola TaxID=579105 RepID=A0A1M6GQP1_9FLAO|nr:GTPase [Mesonia phycicola]SHJ12212.1 hypothetical protein SAMN04488096_108164 [Mesonia phycicola]